MPQKPVIKAKKIAKKNTAANKHGKAGPSTKKGRLEIVPKGKLLKDYLESKEVTKAVNAKNEINFSNIAARGGGRLKALNSAPPVLAPKSTKSAAKSAAAAAREARDAEQMDEDQE